MFPSYPGTQKLYPEAQCLLKWQCHSPVVKKIKQNGSKDNSQGFCNKINNGGNRISPTLCICT